MMHSLSKIGTSICLGFALDEGKIHLEDKLLDYVRDELPEEYDPALEDLTIYHLLTVQVPKNAAIMYGFRSLQKTGRQTG